MAQHLAQTERLIIFTRYPEPGVTKTRMIPALGEQGAANLQREMTEHIVKVGGSTRAQRHIDIEICYFGGNEVLMRNWLGTNHIYRPQADGDLGTKMNEAFNAAFTGGAQRVVIVGSDIPGITPEILHQAFDGLNSSDVILGPATDGGYYLIGLPKNRPGLFSNIGWGTETVLRQTLSIAHDHQLSHSLLEELQDVDLPEDLKIWLADKN